MGAGSERDCVRPAHPALQRTCIGRRPPEPVCVLAGPACLQWRYLVRRQVHTLGGERERNAKSQLCRPERLLVVLQAAGCSIGAGASATSANARRSVRTSAASEKNTAPPAACSLPARLLLRISIDIANLTSFLPTRELFSCVSSSSPPPPPQPPSIVVKSRRRRRLVEVAARPTLNCNLLALIDLPHQDD